MIPVALAYISSFSTLLPLLFGAVKWNNTSKNLRGIVYISALSVIADITAFVLSRSHSNTWPILNIFYVAQLIFFFLALISKRNKIYSHPFTLSFFLIFTGINFFFFEGPYIFNSYTAYVGGILIIIVSLTFLYNLLSERPTEKVQQLPLFWVSFAALVYYAGTIFLFLFNNYLINNLLESHQTIWVLHNILNITKNVFLFTALWVNFKVKIYQP